MSTFGAQIEALIGSIATDADMNPWLEAGAKILVDKIPLEKAEMYSDDDADSGSGVSIQGKRFLRAHKSGYNAPLVTGGLKAQLADSDSLHYAIAKSPRAYIENGDLHILPAGGTGVVMPYPTVLYSESAIANFPSELYQAVVLYAAIYGLQQVYNKYITTDVAAISFGTIPNAPTAPTLTTDSYTNATAATITDITISALASYTDYVNAAIVRPVFDIDVSNQPTAPAFTDIDTDIAFTDASVFNAVVNKSVDLSSQFTELATDLDTEEDIDLANAKMNEIKVRIEEFNTETNVALQEAVSNAKATNDIRQLNAVQTLQGNVQNYQLLLSKYSAQINSWQEEINASYKEHQLNLGAYDRDSQNRLQDALATFNSGLEEYKTDLEHKIKQAEIDLQETLRQSDLTTNVDVQNKLQAIATEIQKDSNKIQKYSTEVQSYGVEVNAVLQEYIGQIGTILQKHQGLMLESQNLQKLYEQELQLYLG